MSVALCILSLLGLAADATAQAPTVQTPIAPTPIADERLTTGAGTDGDLAQPVSPSDRPVEAIPPAASWFPGETIAMARFADVDAFQRQWADSSFGAQMQDPAFAEFFAAVTEQLSGMSDGLGIDLTRLWREAEGELSVGLTRNSDGELAILAVADLADDTTAEQLLQRMERRLRGESSESTSATLGDLRLTSWQRKQDRTIRNLSYFRSGRQIVFSDGFQTLAEVARRGEDRSTQSLLNNDNFSHVMNAVTPGQDASGLQWYVNPLGVVNAAVRANLTAGTSAEAADAMIDRLGLGQFRGFGGSFYLGKGGMDSVSSTYGYVQTPVEGFWKAFRLPATEQRPPDWVKDDVSIYSQINWSAERFLQSVQEMVDRAQGEGAFAGAIGSMSVGNSEMTVSELAEQLSGPLHIAAEIPENAAQLARQKAVFAVGVADPAAIESLVKSLADGAGADPLPAGDRTVYRLSLDTSQFPGMPPMELAVAVSEQSLMFSPNAGYLQSTIAGDNQKRPLAESPQYQEIASQFPEQTSMISYQRQDGRMEGLYEQLRSGLLGAQGLPSLSGQLFNFDFQKLPPFPAMSRYLQSTGSFIVPQEDGFRIVSFATPPREQ
ncbi:DUF3352 domain-containing protein [Roseiconus nitratireducens]|uniref:DUF3352 domain-containing protein n=1 Tax=Roseiconus nitratireducens TaxID=2605748 RepID=UPI0013756FCA|nr:DUF3352 domain-containing protein [Roseiconus nitratireducens]